MFVSRPAVCRLKETATGCAKICLVYESFADYVLQVKYLVCAYESNTVNKCDNSSRYQISLVVTISLCFCRHLCYTTCMFIGWIVIIVSYISWRKADSAAHVTWADGSLRLHSLLCKQSLHWSAIDLHMYVPLYLFVGFVCCFVGSDNGRVWRFFN